MSQREGWKVRPYRDVVVIFKPCYRFLRAGDPMYIMSMYRLPLCRGLTSYLYIVMSLSCIRRLSHPRKNSILSKVPMLSVNGELITLMVKHVQQCFFWACIRYTLPPSDSPTGFFNLLQKCSLFTLFFKVEITETDWTTNKFWMCLVL